MAALAFRLIDPSLHVEVFVSDGTSFTLCSTLTQIEGVAAALPSGERVGLNFAGRQ